MPRGRGSFNCVAPANGTPQVFSGTFSFRPAAGDAGGGPRAAYAAHYIYFDSERK